MLESIVENTRLSDAAKSLSHRKEELDTLRNTIRGDLRNEMWEAALNLIEEMEQRFGFKEEADRFREELDDARNEAIETKLREAIEMVESHFQSHDWDRAQSEIDRLLHALPDNAKVFSLQDRMEALKAERKQELLLEWDEALRRNDTDRAIDILKKLDEHLSVAEAKSLQSSARNVFKEKLLQVGVQFRFAVMEKRWQDALSIGLELIREFPNARMADEVREVLDTLRERARAAPQTEAENVHEVSPQPN
jgi:tetratricopeptide (TPR) repeat protein